jgi:hypothetical protein
MEQNLLGSSPDEEGFMAVIAVDNTLKWMLLCLWIIFYYGIWWNVCDKLLTKEDF